MSDDPQKPRNSLLVNLGLRPMTFEFTVNDAIEVCVIRLQGQDNRDEQRYFKSHGIITMDYRSIKVDINPQKDRSGYSFSITRHGGRTSLQTAKGQLERLSRNSTLVRGEVQPAKLGLQFVTWIVFGLLILMLCSLKVVCVGFIVYSVVLILLGNVSHRKSLISFIEKTVSDTDSAVMKAVVVRGGNGKK